MTSGLNPVRVAPLAPDESLDFEHAESIRGRDFLLTYPRSGTNLTISTLFLLGKGTRKAVGTNMVPLTFQTRVDHRLDAMDYTLFRTHSSDVLSGIDSGTNRLLFLLRNYKEAVPRSLKPGWPKAKIKDFLTRKATSLFSNPDYHGYDRGRRYMIELEKYLDNLHYFDKWAEDTKLLVNYEDLLTDPVRNFERIAHFFDLNRRCFQEVMENFDQHAKQIRRSYHEQHVGSGGSASKGADFFHHSRSLPHPFQLDVDSHIQELYPGLWKKYLLRYVTEAL